MSRRGIAAVAGVFLIASLFAGATVSARAQTPQATANPATKKKIVFLAGPKDHGAVGRHEYEKDLRELAWQLEKATNLRGIGIETVVLVGKAPRDLAVLEDAAAIVIDGSGDWQRNETNVLFQQFQATDGRTYDAETTAYLTKLDQLIRQRGIGVSVFHYTMWVENWVGRRYYLNWLGGLWIPYASHNPVDTWKVNPAKIEHPVLRGVKPWSFRDEVFSRYFLFDNPKRTELLEGTPSNANNGAPRPISWVYERPDGGRSFVWGGSDFHDNMHNVEDYRRYLLNAIIWTAKIDVPAEGVIAPAPPEL
jgi:type 1 glutamine amidotransferase